MLSIGASLEPAAPTFERRAAAGRLCPMDYRYSPAVFDRTADLCAETIYVIGGLYGNLEALDAVLRLADAERGGASIIFNGDFHWFDADPEWFAEIERRTGAYRSLRGNVETELARLDDIGAGCGCAYPEAVDDGIVARSNRILDDLRIVAAGVAPSRRRLGCLPMHVVAQVGRLRIGLVHGDAGSLAGWGFAHDRLDSRDQLGWIAEVRRLSHIDVFASTHTCLAALRSFSCPAGNLTVINNGAAGMPNFTGLRFGVISRIATTPTPHPSLYGLTQDGVFVDALAVAYDHEAFLRRFLARWPEGSPAHRSYWHRISEGPDYPMSRAPPRPAAGRTPAD